jgi:hypothetical protein
MAGNVKVGGGVSQVLGQSQLGSVDPDAFAPQAHGLQANQQITPFPVDPLSIEAATAIAAGAQSQTQSATQEGYGGNAGGDTEVINSGNVGPMVG